MRCYSLVFAALVFASPILNPIRLGAQDLDLDRVEELMAQGRFISARDLLQEWLDATEGEAAWADKQRGTWLRAVLTVDPEMAELDLRRLVVEYPGGPFSDYALLRLAQGAWARSQNSRALQHLEMLLRDYPESQLRAEARSLTSQIEGSRLDDERGDGDDAGSANR